MSQWQNYGFPDLSGVHFQTALHGLLCALKERLQAAGMLENIDPQILNACENMQAYPIFRVITGIDNILDRLDRYILPDNSVFSLKNAAAFLQEELIDMDRAHDTAWNYPCSALKYQWCMQRYRFINLVWKTAPSMQYVNSIYEKSSGSGETYSEAASKLEREDYDNENYNTFEMSQITEQWQDSWSITRYLRIPDRVKYFPSAPQKSRNPPLVFGKSHAILKENATEVSLWPNLLTNFGTGDTWKDPTIYV